MTLILHDSLLYYVTKSHLSLSGLFFLEYSVGVIFFNQMFVILYGSNTNILSETTSERVNSYKDKKGKMSPHSWLSLKKSAPALTFATGKVKQSSTSSKSIPVCGYCQNELFWSSLIQPMGQVMLILYIPAFWNATVLREELGWLKYERPQGNGCLQLLWESSLGALKNQAFLK